MSDRYEFIDAEYATVPGKEAGNAPAIVQMCRWLGVSKSGYYDWRSRLQSAAAARRELLKIKIKALFEANDGTPSTTSPAQHLPGGALHAPPWPR